MSREILRAIKANPDILNRVVSLEERVEREAIQADCQPSYFELAPAFLAKEDPPVNYLIDELLPEQVLALLHGEPRTRKSWAALEIAIAVATGTPAFGLDRFTVREPVPVLYSSQEDAARDVRIRTKALLRGRDIETFPEPLAFSVHSGIDLESSSWQNDLIRDVTLYGFRVVIFDPIRRYAANVDKGPAEVRAVTGYLRRLSAQTGTTILIVHHDVKPPANGPDNRRRGHRASGGDWFAACECPISFELAGETQTIAYPESFKLSSDPDPFKFRLETDDTRHPTIARLVADTATSAEAATLAIDEAVLTYLSEHPAASGTAVSKGIRKQKDAVLDSLNRLFETNAVDCVDGPRRAKLWTLRPVVPSGSV